MGRPVGSKNNNFKQVEINCDKCGKSFFKMPCRLTTRNYCSKECKNSPSEFKKKVRTPKGKYGARKIFNCVHCQRQFYDYDYLTLPYCSTQCENNYEPIQTYPFNSLSEIQNRFHKSFRQYLITILRESQGEHSYNIKSGMKDDLTELQAEKIKQELKSSWLKEQDEKKRIISHLSSARIDEIIQGQFDMLQSMMFLGNIIE